MTSSKISRLPSASTTLVAIVLTGFCVLLHSCNGNETPPPSLLIGNWTRESYVRTVITPNGNSLVAYFESKGYSHDESVRYAQGIEAPATDASATAFEFKSDFTFVAYTKYPGQTQSGTWSVSDDQKTLVFNRGEPNEAGGEIIVTESHLTIKFQGKVNFDGVQELVLKQEYGLVRSQ